MERVEIERPRSWQQDELTKLRILAPDHSLTELSVALNRSPGAVATKALQERIRFRVTRPDLPVAEPEVVAEQQPTKARRLMKARWIEGFWKTPKATATFYEGDEDKLPRDFRQSGRWADIKASPGFSNGESDTAIASAGYYIWPQTIVD